MKRYWTLLQSEPLLRNLSMVQLIAYFGAWFSNVAIYTLLIQLGADAGMIAFVAALHFLPGVFQAPLSGVLIDRINPKKLMLLLTSIEIICTFFLLSVNSINMLWLLYLLVFIRMGASSFHFTVEMSLLPRILEGKALQIANEIHSIIWSISYTFGMALSGIVVYYVGIKAAFLLDALLFIVAWIILYRLPIPTLMKSSGRGFFCMMRETYLYLKNNSIIAHLIVLHAVVGFTAFDALVALAAKHYYAQIIAVSMAIGLTHAFRAFGLVIGPMVLGHRMNNRRLFFLLIAEGCAIALWGYVIEDFYLSLAASIIVGFMTTTLWSYTYTLLQEHTNAEYYGRVVAYNDMIFLGVGAGVSILIGFMAKSGFMLHSIAYLLAGVFLLCSVYYLWIRTHYSIKEIE